MVLIVASDLDPKIMDVLEFPNTDILVLNMTGLLYFSLNGVLSIEELNNSYQYLSMLMPKILGPTINNF
jgi:hypothetical protein